MRSLYPDHYAHMGLMQAFGHGAVAGVGGAMLALLLVLALYEPPPDICECQCIPGAPPAQLYVEAGHGR